MKPEVRNIVKKCVNKTKENGLPVVANLEQYTPIDNGVVVYCKLSVPTTDKKIIKREIEKAIGKNFVVEALTISKDKVRAFCSTLLKKEKMSMNKAQGFKISANVFQTNDDKIWNIETQNGINYLVRDVQEDMEALLDERKNFTSITASYIEKITAKPKFGSVAIFYDSNARCCKSGVVLESNAQYSLINDGAIDYKVNNQCIASLDEVGVAEQLEEVENIEEGMSTSSDVKQKAIDYYSLMYKHNDEAKNMMIQMIENMEVN